MGFWEELKHEFRVQFDNEAPREKSKPRDVTEQDRLDWYDAGGERSTNMKPQTVQDVQRLIRNRNPVRWHRVNSDYKWVQKEMKKLGLNPEDARYLL